MTVPLQWTDRGLLYMQLRAKTNGDIFFMNRAGDISTILATEPATTQAQISPNGKWMTYTEWQANIPVLYVQAFPEGNLRWKVTGKRGSNAKWSQDGKTLYYASFNQILSTTVSERNDAPLFGEPELVYEFSGSARIAYDPFDISPDGELIAVIDKIYSNPPTQVFVSNWKSMLADN
jgi:Tol biopolymer transport system component